MAHILSISSIGRSRKRDDATTIGRYGLGFNVAYHFTDCVQFVSGEDVVVFDPHGASLPGGELGMRRQADATVAARPSQ